MVKEIILVKEWWKSKTLWINAGLFVLAVLSFIVGQLEAGITLGFASIANFIIRYFTNKGLIKY